SKSFRPALPILAFTLLIAPMSFAAARDPLPIGASITVPPRMPSPGGRASRVGPRRTSRSLPFAPGEVVVIADEGVLGVSPGGALLSHDGRAAGVLAGLGLDRSRLLGPTPGRGAARRERIWLLTSARPGFDPVGAARTLQATGAFRAASPNYSFDLLLTQPNDPKPEYTPDASGIDVGFHGTMCAGIAAAATDNGDGIAGAGWNSRIMPLKVSRPDSGLTSSAIAAAFAYAVDERASVISMSFGGPGDLGVPEFFQALVDVATYSGALCVAAAGNDSDSVRVYPAGCNNVLAVATTDFDNTRAFFSNWGPWVDVAAPGSSMWSTICQNYTFTDLDQLIYIFFFGWDGVNPYMYGDGTSFACPLTD